MMIIIYFFYKLTFTYIRNSFFIYNNIQVAKKRNKNGERLYLWMWKGLWLISSI